MPRGKGTALEPAVLEAEGLSGEFCLRHEQNPAVCPACGTFTKLLWTFLPDSGTTVVPISCPACAGTDDEGNAL